METTVIIGVYNNIDYVEETINSIKLQTYTNWNCIIVDNDSPDNSFEFIQELIKNDNRFICFKKKNEGPSSCRNFGVSKIATNPKYIHFLDGDDFLDKTFLEKMTSYLNEHPDVGLVGCHFNIIDIESKFIKKEIRSRVAKNSLGLPKLLKSQDFNTPFVSFFSATGMGPFALFRASTFLKTKGYENNFWSHEDADIFCQMALLAKVHYLPYHLYNKRTHTNNLTTSTLKNYDEFRNKWDYYSSADTKINLKIEESIKYYYCIHSPFRDLKVAFITMKILLKNKKDTGQINWIGELLRSCIDNLIFKKKYKEIINNRQTLQIK
jgi:glycosyltransferase involved in cell wall biosynthesis